MRQVTRKGLITVAAAGGVIALGGGYAHAEAGANGTASNSPGIASGNSVQAPVHAPVNICGNTVSVVGLINPSFGNKCANVSEPGGGGSSAEGSTSDSPGIGSGNNVQAPVHVPVNVCGNSVTGVGAINPTFGNECDNGIEPTHPGHPEQPGNPGNPSNPGNPENPGNPGTPENPGTPGTPVSPGGGSEHPGGPATPQGPNQPDTDTIAESDATEELAETGSGPLGMIIPAGAGLLLAGSVIYRRARRSA
ncbi:chaplin family protein [Streptomyces sp. NPDC015346]|uniref:chaplin family protein n=1 Tax=Streptomyces sp. NPDC015346 TaxID=3364954 RepID=UPI0036F954E9